MNKRYLHALILGGLIALSSQSYAQQTQTLAPASDQRAILANALRILDQVGVILPGKGFKSIGLGDTPKHLITQWGQPIKKDPKGILSYQLDLNTLIHFQGKSVIESIVIQGKQGSFARVINGLAFGEQPQGVRSAFTQAPRIQNASLYYDRLGIAFTFTQNALSKIIVFSPK
ncbi:MAG: hypothetical protein V3V09_08180 [Arenicellales bacterium]